MMEKFLTVKEIAEILRVSDDTITRLLKQGKLVGYKVENSWRVNESDLQEYMSRQRNVQDK